MSAYHSSTRVNQAAKWNRAVCVPLPVNISLFLLLEYLYIRNKTQPGMLTREKINNASFPRHPEAFYSTSTTSLCQPLFIYLLYHKRTSYFSIQFYFKQISVFSPVNKRLGDDSEKPHKAQKSLFGRTIFQFCLTTSWKFTGKWHGLTKMKFRVLKAQLRKNLLLYSKRKSRRWRCSPRCIIRCISYFFY